MSYWLIGVHHSRQYWCVWSKVGDSGLYSGKAQLSPREVEMSKKLSQVKIHVERVILAF